MVYGILECIALSGHVRIKLRTAGGLNAHVTLFSCCILGLLALGACVISNIN